MHNDIQNVQLWPLLTRLRVPVHHWHVVFHSKLKQVSTLFFFSSGVLCNKCAWRPLWSSVLLISSFPICHYKVFLQVFQGSWTTLLTVFFLFFSFSCQKSYSQAMVGLGWNYILSTFRVWFKSILLNNQKFRNTAPTIVNNMFCNSKNLREVFFAFTQFYHSWSFGIEKHFYRPSVHIQTADFDPHIAEGLVP